MTTFLNLTIQRENSDTFLYNVQIHLSTFRSIFVVPRVRVKTLRVITPRIPPCFHSYPGYDKYGHGITVNGGNCPLFEKFKYLVLVHLLNRLLGNLSYLDLCSWLRRRSAKNDPFATSKCRFFCGRGHEFYNCPSYRVFKTSKPRY